MLTPFAVTLLALLWLLVWVRFPALPGRVEPWLQGRAAPAAAGVVTALAVWRITTTTDLSWQSAIETETSAARSTRSRVGAGSSRAQGYSRRVLQPAPARVNTRRSWSRSARPCQNSISSGSSL